MNKPTRYFSKHQENTVAKAVGGKRTANSGATRWSKGDVKTDKWLLECKTKTSESQSISIKKEWLDKNAEEAFAMNKPHSALVFNFGGLHNTENYYIINEHEFKRLLKLDEE
jgi:hypothetical protein